jgi:hypothetical protein
MSDFNSVIEKAFDYRGDVTLKLKDGRTMVGYVYNREPKGTARRPEPFVEIMPGGSSEKVMIKYAEISGIDFTGEDTAAGKSWEDWHAKEEDKKAAGKIS